MHGPFNCAPPAARACASFFLDVLRDVHPALAAPFVKASLQQVLALQVEDVTIRNVVFKLQLTHHALGEDWYLSLVPNSSLKKWRLCALNRLPCLFGKRAHIVSFANRHRL